MRSVLLLSLCVVCGPFLACGGGGGGDPQVYTLEAPLYESLSGTVANDAPGGDVVDHSPALVGDLTDNTTWRAFYTFITADLPPSARVQSAVLSARQYLVVGFPYEDLSDVVVDHIDVGPTLDAPDYTHIQWTLDIGTLSTTTGVGWRTLDVAAAVRADLLAGRQTTTLRLRFRLQTDVDSEPDYAGFSPPSLADPDQQASLTITYTLP